jgi:rhamnogalacturonan endolyase
MIKLGQLRKFAGIVRLLALVITSVMVLSVFSLMAYSAQLTANLPLNKTGDYICGDVNGSGNVDSTDYAIVKRYVLGIISDFKYEYGFLAADVSGDGAINSTDYMFMKRYLLEIISGFPVERPVTTPAPIKGTYSPVPVRQEPQNGRQMEYLDRGVVAVNVSNGVFISWRLFGTDPSNIAFNLYRSGTKLNSLPITGATNYVDYGGTTSSTYYVCPVINGQEREPSETTGVWAQDYLSIPLQPPTSLHIANDCSTGDLDGDGQYEIILKWEPLNAKDNSLAGVTDSVFIDAYKLNGTRLWRIDLGRNIRAGAHYTQFMVYDLDGDGMSELACKTADGTKDGEGKVIGDANADYRNKDGYILTGPEYLTIFDGRTGAALKTVNYEPARGGVSTWGDTYGNRVDRFLACIAYLDGERPSLVMCRGYYTRTVLVAYNWRNGSLSKVWTFDSNNGYSDYAGQGNPGISVADVDGDGRDEIIYGSICIDDNGKGLWNARLGRGNAMHVSDIDSSRPGLEIWGVHEGDRTAGSALLDARTGEIIWKTANGDVSGGVAADLLASSKGMECWGGTDGLRSCKNTHAGINPSSSNHVIWWDGDLLRELLNETFIDKYGGARIFSASGCSAINGVKANPCLQADILGDWREEVIFRTRDNKMLKIYTTTFTTDTRIYTLMHDPQYRLSVAWQNVAYNQSPHTGFFLGEGMTQPPTPEIRLVRH